MRRLPCILLTLSVLLAPQLRAQVAVRVDTSAIRTPAFRATELIAPGALIATGIGIKAVEAGYKVMFVNAKDLVDRLHDSMLAGTLKETLEELGKIPLLIVDELSYVKMDKERESLFFQIIRQRYEKKLPHNHHQPPHGKMG